jgi:HEPN domain-containing protein
MPPETYVPGSPDDWLRHARSDLLLARQQVPPEVLLAMLCFHAQQAVEKSLKAVLLAHGRVFPYTHDLAQLITLVKHAGLPWPDALDTAAELSVYAVGTRYPGVYGDLTADDHTQAIEIARQVVAWAEALLHGSAA